MCQILGLLTLVRTSTKLNVLDIDLVWNDRLTRGIDMDRSKFR